MRFNSQPGKLFEDGIFAITGLNAPVFSQDDELGKVFEDGVFASNEGYWLEIGTGFSADGHRWEAVQCGDYMVFNNGLDLPVSYHLVDYLAVQPLHELREVGVARVGTIATIDGVLVCCDVTSISDLEGYFTDYAGSAYDIVTDPARVIRVPSRVLWSSTDPRRFAMNVACSVTAGSQFVTLAYAVSSLESGQEITLLGAGAAGGNLTTTITNYAAGGTVLTVEDIILTTVEDALLARSDAAGSISAYEDLIADGSPIIKALELDGWLVLYRDTSIQLGDFTGNASQPFVFSKPRSVEDASLCYRNTLVSVTWNERTFHMYAGRNAFYRFDLATRTPSKMALFHLADDDFFRRARIADDDDIFAAVNGLTHEVFIFNKLDDDEADQGLCFDYEFNTLSTTSLAITAAATTKRPNVNQGSLRQTEDWFVMGDSHGMLLLYGLTNEPNEQWSGEREIFHRCTEDYTSTLRAGLSHFGDRFNEKQVVAHVVFLASFSEDTELTLNLYGSQNPTETPTLIGTRDITSPATLNLTQTHFRKFFFADEVVVSGQGNSCVLAARVWNVSGVGSQSFSRRVT